MCEVDGHRFTLAWCLARSMARWPLLFVAVVFPLRSFKTVCSASRAIARTAMILVSQAIVYSSPGV